MRDHVNETCRNIEFDFLFLEYVKKYRLSAKGEKNKTHFSNGVMLQQYLTFKVICTLRDQDLQSEHISDRYHAFLGTGINQPSLARALRALDTIGLVNFIDNDFDKRMKSIKLTKQGKKMQYLMTGSTKPYEQMETAIRQFKYHANVNVKNRNL